MAEPYIIIIMATLQTTDLQMITGALRARGIVLQRARILECLRRIDPVIIDHCRGYPLPFEEPIVSQAQMLYGEAKS